MCVHPRELNPPVNPARDHLDFTTIQTGKRVTVELSQRCSTPIPIGAQVDNLPHVFSYQITFSAN